MKLPAPILLLLPAFYLPMTVTASPLDVIGDDDASKAEYRSGWNSGKGDGVGFSPWTLQTTTQAGSNSSAGFYIASEGAKTDLNGAAMRGKAFGMYANGVGFETAAAFRSFDRPLQAGQSFSFLVEHGDIVKKFETDDAGGGSIGLTLRATKDAVGANDYNKAVRFEFGYYKSASGYMIYDADGGKALEVPFTDAGLAVTITLVTADTYDLEVTTLANKKTVKLTGRKLGGTAGEAISSFCIFDRNGETNDAYFNGFQILQQAK